MLTHLGVIARNQGDYDRAVSLYERSLAIDRQRGDRRSMAVVLNNLANIAGVRRDFDGAPAITYDLAPMKTVLPSSPTQQGAWCDRQTPRPPRAPNGRPGRPYL